VKMSDRLRENINNKKNSVNAKEEVGSAFNMVALKLLRKFTEEVEAGSIEVTDISDVMRLYNMFLSVNDLQNGEEGSGKLPALPREQRKLLEDSITTVKARNEEEEDQDYINDFEFENKTAEEIAELLTRREAEVNKTNEGVF